MIVAGLQNAIDRTPTQPERRNLDRDYKAEVIHYDGGYSVIAGMTRLNERLSFETAHTLAAIHNEARINMRFAAELRGGRS